MKPRVTAGGRLPSAATLSWSVALRFTVPRKCGRIYGIRLLSIFRVRRGVRIEPTNHDTQMSTTDETNDAEQDQNDSEPENTQKYCDACGEYVTRAYHRVFSDNDGVLHGCINCSPMGMDRGGNR